jgi:hypothetical protein
MAGNSRNKVRLYCSVLWLGRHDFSRADKAFILVIPSEASAREESAFLIF